MDTIISYAEAIEVNKQVYIFCWRCRHHKEVVAGEWGEKLANIISPVTFSCKPYTLPACKVYLSFVQYALIQHTGELNNLGLLLGLLYEHTRRWTIGQFEYADYLFRKYYNVGEPLP